MTIYQMPPQYESVCICGDIHGEFATLVYNLKRLGIENSVVIVAGDCGVGFEKENHYNQLYSKLLKSLEKSNNILILVRGNHDDPTYFDGKRIDFDRMKCIPDYSVIKAAGKTVLCVGGAISIDRSYRKEVMGLNKAKHKNVKPLYWEDEPVIFDEIALNEACKEPINTVVTHTSPSFCYPTTKSGIRSYLLKDENLESELSQERALMDKLFERIIAKNTSLQSWYYAHFHDSHTEFINNIKFCLLGINEIKRCN